MDRRAGIENHLQQIVESAAFRRADTLGRMLRFLVTRSLDGRVDDLREYVLATEVFGRGDSFDRQTDTIVRVQASRLRSRLKEYYETEGSSSTVRITFAKGSYAPLFEYPCASEHQPSLAVLPFQNFTGDAEFGYVTDGLTEEVINVLTRVEGLAVIARTSVFAIHSQGLDVREIGRRLNVTLILEGSVRRAGESIRVTAQLIDAATGHHRLSANHERRMGDLFELQDDISQRIVSEIQRDFAMQLGQQTPVHRPDPDAYLLFLKARYQFHRLTPEAAQQGAEGLRRALALDPDYADAYAQLALHYALPGWLGMAPPRKVFPEVKTLAVEALERDADNGIAMTAMAFVSAYEWDVADFLHWSERACETVPGEPTAQIMRALALLALGRWDAAVAGARRAATRDPLNLLTLYNVGFVLWMARRSDEALAAWDRVFELNPDYPEALCCKGITLLERGDYQPALDHFTRGNRLHGGVYGLEYFPWCYRRMGRDTEAAQAMNTLLEAASQVYIGPTRIAVACLGDDSETLRYLELGFAEHDPRFICLYVWPIFLHLHSDPRFVSLAQRVGVHPPQAG